MGRQKNTPKKYDNEIEYKCPAFIPVIRKRKKRNQPNTNTEKLFNILLPTEASEQFYLGELLIGQTNNVFPTDYKSIKLCFKTSEVDDNEESQSCIDDSHFGDIIVLLCDNVSVIVKSYGDINFIKDLISHHKIFSFDFICKEDIVHLKIYLTKLPLPKFSIKLGHCISSLCSLLYGGLCTTKVDASEKTSKKFHGIGEISKLYQKLREIHTNHYLNIKQENVQHPQLKPTLRPYQSKSVQWMLHRERMVTTQTDHLHPLYTAIKLQSGIEIYLDTYSGFITSEKPIIAPTSRGGILADEMGLGKTVEVLACVLLNPKTGTENNCEQIEGDLDGQVQFVDTRKRHIVDDSSDESDADYEPRPSKSRNKYILDDREEDLSLKTQRKKRKVVVHAEKNNTNQSNGSKTESKKSQTFLALDMWYKSILSGISTVRSEPVEDPNRKIVQCICGSTLLKGITKCSNCNKYQHRDCLGYKKSLGKYLCPQCWMDEPLLDSGATLIVTPMALKTQWQKEICRHIKGKLKVLQYLGSTATPIYPTELKDFNIVLTTYSVLQNELRLTESTQIFNLRKEKKYCAPGSPLTRLNWWRLCLDEAQTVETPGRMVSEMARKISAVYRWAVTGTPISKNISDVYGLIDYLQMSPYNDITTWNKILYEPYVNGNEEPLVNFLSNVLWRTAKKDVMDQINIPKQTYLEHTLEFSAVEKYFYKREHELICNDFLSKVTKYDLSIHLESLDKSSLKKLLAPLLTLRHACTHPNTVRGRYLATKKQVTSMKELLNALILKNTNDSEDCLRLIISAYNGLAGIHLLVDTPQEAINSYREVLQLAARFSGENGEAKLTVDKPQVIHSLHNLAEVINIFPPDQPTLRDDHLRQDCEDLEKKYMEKFINESTVAFETFSAIMTNVETMQNKFLLKDGQWYSDGLDWVLLNGHFDELLNKIQTACENANVNNTARNSNERTLLQLIYLWDDDLSDLRVKLFDAVENLYDYQPESVHKIVIKENLVTQAMNCHLRPQKKGKQAPKCPVCIANDHLKKYEETLFGMKKREKTFEEMSLKGSWKPTLQELVLKALHVLLRAKNAKPDFIKDGELHISIIENLKKEFKELRRLWTLLDQQICARDELDICKVRLQLKTEEEEQKKNKTLKNLTYDLENKHATINLLSAHELDYQMSLLENEVKQNTRKLEKLLGTQSYLETLRKQQYEGQSPDPCPICKNTLEQHWSILLCGHSYCLECIQVLLEQTAGDHIQCSICRNKQKYQEISYIKAGNTVTDDDCKKIKGNYSTKIEAIIKVLLDLKNKNKDVKVLVFSSWMTVLKCLKEALDTNSISCELAHSGNLDIKITTFKDSTKNIMVLLLPVNLGSKGLNLIEATHVILVEPLLNPADELQAIGRVNRIGQTKATFVHKFLIKNTIEENIHQATTSNAENWEKSAVTLQHLVDLFNTTELPEALPNLQELNPSVLPTNAQSTSVDGTTDPVQSSISDLINNIDSADEIIPNTLKENLHNSVGSDVNNSSNKLNVNSSSGPVLINSSDTERFSIKNIENSVETLPCSSDNTQQHSKEIPSNTSVINVESTSADVVQDNSLKITAANYAVLLESKSTSLHE